MPTNRPAYNPALGREIQLSLRAQHKTVGEKMTYGPWKSWRDWFKEGKKDHLDGKPIAYPNQLDYVNGYNSVLMTSKEWDERARAITRTSL
jgi:hypothetical protein